MRMDHLVRVAGFAAIALALVSLALTAQAVLSAWSPLPFWDQWERVTTGQLFANWFAPHNEHRIVVPSLFFMIDSSLFGGRNVFLLVSIWVIQAVHTALLIWLARRAGARGVSLLLMGGFITGLMFAGAQVENFYWGFQVQFVLVYLLATTCLAITVLAPIGWKGDAAAMIAGFAAAFTFSAGLVVLPAAATGAFLAGKGWRRTGILAAAAILAGLLYVTGLDMSGPSSGGSNAQNLLNVVYYLLVYLGGPLGDAFARSGLSDIAPALRDRVQAAQFFGMAGLGLALLMVPATLLRGGTRTRLVLLLIAGVVVVAGLLTGFGRVEMGASQAMASRYATPVLLFWATLGALAWPLVRSIPSRNWREGGFIVLGAAFIGANWLLVENREEWLNLARAQGERSLRAETAILVGAPDRPVLAGVYPVPARVLEQARFLSENRLSVFASEEAGWLGTGVAEAGEIVADGRCTGSVDVRNALPALNGSHRGFVQLAGWAYDMEAGDSLRTYVIAGPDGRVRGLGRLVADRPDVTAAVSLVTRLRTGWTGHAQADANETLTVYGVLDSGRERRLCRIGAI